MHILILRYHHAFTNSPHITSLQFASKRLNSTLHRNVDVRARLDEMETRVYTSDYAFQSEVSDLSEWFGLAKRTLVLTVGTCGM
jgi:hypothetical protein